MQSEAKPRESEHPSVEGKADRAVTASRRAVLATAAWAVPAVIATAASPAAAASGLPVIVLTVQPTAIVGERVSVSALLTTFDGTPMSGYPVTFMVDDTSVGVFVTVSKSVTVATDASGVALVSVLNIKGSGTLLVTATGEGASSTKIITIDPSTGTIQFDQGQYDVTSNSVNEVRGSVTLVTGTVRPTYVLLTYTGDVTGPASVLVAGGGSFRITGVNVGAAGGTITGSANGFGTAVATFVVVP